MPSPLLTAALSTFESLAMLCAEPLVAGATPARDAGRAGPGHAPPTLAHAVRVSFAGPAAGALVLAVSDDVATALAASMLGLDEDAVRADARIRQDALGEVANVVCGNVLPLVAGRAAVFHLAAPEPVAVTDALGAPARYVEALLVEQGRAEVVLYLDAPSPECPGAVRAPVPVQG